MTDYLKEKRLIYTNVFGQTIYNPEKGKNKFVLDSSIGSDDGKNKIVNDQIKDILTRESGLGKTIYKTERARQAVASPTDYLQKKSEDLMKIRNLIIEKYKELYPENLNRYHDPELAYKRTMSEIKSYKTDLMSDHVYEFPTKIKDDTTIAKASTTEESK